MELLRFSGLECHYGAREIFTGASGVLDEGERIGLVGPNGAGKSSLLRLLAGVDRPYGGTIARAKGVKLGYLAQGVADETESTLQQLVDAALANAPPDAWPLRNKSLRIMLAAFGFTGADFDRPLRAFSGGQRAKAALAHLLIDEPEYFILDEPTNHLDIGTVRWLESFIAGDKRGFVVVSHDRYFLDRIATRIWEIDRKELRAYAPAPHAYTAYVEAKALRLEEERRAYEAFVAERDKRRATIAGLRATHTSSDYSQVRSRERQLARVEGAEATTAPPPPAATIGVRLQASRRAGSGFAFEAKALSKAYANPLFTGLTIDVERGERLGVVGPNGSGKSTFLKILAGQMLPDAGAVRFNPAAQIAYFAQNSHEQLDVAKTAVDAVLANAPQLAPQEARSLLGRLRISGEAADKAVRDFSGGERRRIMLACLMARKADVLLLDEPTNDLDIESREALEAVLSEFEGATVVVSHDRFLLARLCERVLWIEGGAWGVVGGGYEVYEASQRERDVAARDRAAESPVRPKASRQTPLRVRSQLQAQIARTEREIEAADARVAEIEHLFAQPETYADPASSKALSAELDQLKAGGHERVARWEALLNELESLPP